MAVCGSTAAAKHVIVGGLVLVVVFSHDLFLVIQCFPDLLRVWSVQLTVVSFDFFFECPRLQSHKWSVENNVKQYRSEKICARAGRVNRASHARDLMEFGTLRFSFLLAKRSLSPSTDEMREYFL
jgi:hypothetical protein